jgi:hypothetical protein
MGNISEHLSELVEQGAERSVTIYDPDKGLKMIAVAEAGERHWRRAKDAGKLFEAITHKIDAQADYVVWRDGVVVPSRQGGGPGRGKKRGLERTPVLPTADPGTQIVKRWRRKFCVKERVDGKRYTKRDQAKLDIAYELAQQRSLRICEQEPDGTVRGTEGTGEFERYTPAKYIEPVRQVLGEIDLDPATSELAQQTVRAIKYFTLDDNGLLQDWRGRIFLNPPYHRELMPAFIDKLIVEIGAGRVTEAILLTNNSTDTEWFSVALRLCDQVCFTHGRINFLDQYGNAVLPTQGQAFFYYGANLDKFLSVFNTMEGFDGWVGLCLGRPSRPYQPPEKNEEEQDADET